MRIAFFYAIMLFSSLATAAVPIDGLYGSVFGGYSAIPDNLEKTQNGIKFTRIENGDGFNVGGRFGYQANYWRYEGELTYIRTTINTFNINPLFLNTLGQFGPFPNTFGLFPNTLGTLGLPGTLGTFGLPNNLGLFPNALGTFGLFPNTLGSLRLRGADGHSHMIIGTANVYYDFPEMVPCIAPFLGGGLGAGWFKTDFSFYHLNSIFNNPNLFVIQAFSIPLQPIHYSGSSAAFVYQGTAGLTYNFAENYSINLAYRYIGSNRISAFGKTLKAHLASVGVIYRFNEYNYK